MTKENGFLNWRIMRQDKIPVVLSPGRSLVIKVPNASKAFLFDSIKQYCCLVTNNIVCL